MNIQDSQNIATLIRSGSSGYFTLYDIFRQNCYGVFPSVTNETETSRKATPQDLATGLLEMLDLLGNGKYLIELKNNSKDTKALISYKFTHGNIDNVSNSKNAATGVNGIGYAEVQNIVNAQVEAALTKEREYLEREKKLWELEKKVELSLLKTEHSNAIAGLKEKTKEVPKNSTIEAFAPLITAIGIGTMMKISPESEGLIRDAIAAFNFNDAGNEKEEPEKVVRTD